MISRAEKNYYINIPLTVIGFTCLISGLLLGDKSISTGGINLRSLHIWSGYIMTGLIVLHLLMHVKWIKNVTTGIFKSRLKVASLIATILVSVGVCYFSGSASLQGSNQGHSRGQNQSTNQSGQDRPDFNSTN